jgi:hypothetical protein
MLSIEKMYNILAQVSYKDWNFTIHETNGSPYLQITFLEKDSAGSGTYQLQFCRKWQLSYHMVPSEIVRTAYMAVRAAVLHETDELFKYKETAIFNPHIDLDKLSKWLDPSKLSART